MASAYETAPLVEGERRATSRGTVKRSSTYRVHEQLDPERIEPMEYGGKGSRRVRVGLPPSVESMDLPTNSSQTRQIGHQQELSCKQATSLVCKYLTVMFMAVGLFGVVAYFVNDMVKTMTRRGFHGG
jgi:hypothetical protein